MCHPSFSFLRAHFHNTLPWWKLFPVFCSSLFPPTSTFLVLTSSFSPYTAWLVLEQEIFMLGFFSSVTSVPILLGFCTLSVFPSFLSNLVLCPWNPPLGARVSAVPIMHVRSSGKWKLFWDAVWLKCCTAEWPKSILCAGDSSDRAVSCRGAELDAACGSTWTAGNVGFPRTGLCEGRAPTGIICAHLRAVPGNHPCLGRARNLTSQDFIWWLCYLVSCLFFFSQSWWILFATDNCVISSNIFTLVIRNTCSLKDLVFS